MSSRTSWSVADDVEAAPEAILGVLRDALADGDARVGAASGRPLDPVEDPPDGAIADRQRAAVAVAGSSRGHGRRRRTACAAPVRATRPPGSGTGCAGSRGRRKAARRPWRGSGPRTARAAPPGAARRAKAAPPRDRSDRVRVPPSVPGTSGAGPRLRTSSADVGDAAGVGAGGRPPTVMQLERQPVAQTDARLGFDDDRPVAEPRHRGRRLVRPRVALDRDRRDRHDRLRRPRGLRRLPPPATRHERRQRVRSRRAPGRTAGATASAGRRRHAPRRCARPRGSRPARPGRPAGRAGDRRRIPERDALDVLDHRAVRVAARGHDVAMGRLDDALPARLVAERVA